MSERRNRISWIWGLVLIMAFSGCKIYHTAGVDVQTIRMEVGSVEAAPDIEAMILPYREELSVVMDEVIAYNSAMMEKGRPESSLTNWVCDALMSAAVQHFDNVDFAVQNYGGIRIRSLAQGDVTVGKIFELMPFDNMMIVLTMDSSEVHELCHRMAGSGGWPVSKELNYVIDSEQATAVNISGDPLSSRRTYRVVISDYIANGGDRLHFLRDLPREDKGVLIRDALLDMARQSDTIPVILPDQRIRVLEIEQQ